MASDILLVSDFPSWKGEASRHGLTNAIDVHSFSFGASRGPVPGDPLALGVPAFTSVDIMAALDTGTIQLFSMFVTNMQIKEVTLLQFRAGGDDDVELWKLTMREAIVGSMSFSGGDGSVPAICSFSLHYRTGELEARPQSEAGQAGGSTVVVYDLAPPSSD